jgi:Fe-S-cluster containining protein
LEINRETIALLAEQRQDENDDFRAFIKNKDGDSIDAMVFRINDTITPEIDCTQCGACCKMLMINVTDEETKSVSQHLQLSIAAFKEKYIEESLQGKMIINSIPCHFLEDNKCTVYEQRFTECREFPHLHRKNFKDRLFGTLVHYAMCPIIFNVVEELKVETGFTTLK